MKKAQMVVAVILAVLLLGAGLSFAQQPKFQKTWKVYFSTMIYQYNWQGKIVERWAKEIEERSGGALKMQLYWPGQLPYKGFEILTTIQGRLLDAAECLTTYYGNTDPLMDPKWQFYTMDTLDQLKKALAVQEKYLQPTFDKYRAVPLIKATSGGDQNWFSKKPVTKMSDMKGLKCRVYSKATADLVKEWGCNPITIPIVELYTALQRGVVDSVVTSYTTGADVKFWEVLPYATDMNWNVGGLNTVLANKGAWDELPPEIQKVVREASDKASEEIYRESPLEEKRLRDLFRKGGVKILQLDPGEKEKFREKTAVLWKQWLDAVGEKGIPMLKEVEKETGIPILKYMGKR
jgi:TRAP-type C4-dicarboxylate transport system substrate-binding protein